MSIAVIVSLAVGGVLLALAVPRLVAAVTELPGRSVVSEVRGGAPLESAVLASAARSLQGANRWVEEAERWSALGLVQLVQANRAAAGSPAWAALLRESRAASRRSVALNPAMGYAWIRLAQVEFYLGGVTPEMVRALEMGYRTTRYDRRAAFIQAELALTAWSRLNDTALAAATEQFGYAVRRDARRLARLAERRRAAPIIRRAIRSDPVLLRRFDRALLELRGS